MKVAVSVPDDVVDEADRIARHLSISRSGLCSRAITEFLARHAPDPVTEAMDRACNGIGVEPEVFVRTAARRVLERNEW